MSTATLPPIGTYWTTGALTTGRHMFEEAYSTCARCGAFVNAEDRHDDWHRAVDPVSSSASTDGSES